MVEKFETWAVVEVCGHQKYAGFVTEQAIGGASFVRVDVPEVSDHEAFSKLFGAAAIYSITPCSEELAKVVAERTTSTALNVYCPELYPPKETKAIPSGDPFDGDDHSFNTAYSGEEPDDTHEDPFS